MRGRKLCFVGLRISLVSLLLLVKIFLCGQIKWDGGAGDGQWSNPVNWTGDILPIAGDDVMLDNTFIQGSYKVFFPAGNVSVSVRSLLIAPSGSDSIVLELPKINTISPGLQVTGSSYPLTIKKRGTLINASGSGSGASIVVSDSIRIENGGTYVHRTARAHAALVMLLSRAPGTEEGQFWFDVPDVSSTISLSNRTFGKLMLSATAAGGSLNYTAASTQKIRVRSDLCIGAGVKLNLNCSDTFHIARNLIQEGGTLNLSSSTRLLIMAVAGNVTLAQSGVITETGSALPVLLLNGRTNQSFFVEGILSNQVTIRLDNAAGAILHHPLQVPYLFDLKKGMLTTDSMNLLTILPSGKIKADSLTLNTFINGPLQMQGLNSAYRLFPVGASNELRWISLHNATGDFTITYIRADGRLIDSRVMGIHHISGQEYWKLESGSLGQTAAAELSFNDANQSGITDLSSLHVARLKSDGWNDAGNQATRGSAGGRGSVTSDVQLLDAAGSSELFVLAASNGAENPLPLYSVQFRIDEKAEEAIIRFDTTGIYKVELQQRIANDSFVLIGTKTNMDWLDLAGGTSFKINRSISESVYRLAFYLNTGSVITSREFLVHPKLTVPFDWKAVSVNGELKLNVLSKENRPAELSIYDLSGRMLMKKPLYIKEGNQLVTVAMHGINERLVVFRFTSAGFSISKILRLK